MGFKISIVLLTLLAGGLLNRDRERDKVFCIIACITAILLSGLRHIHVGVDTYNYWGMFERCKDIAWADMLMGFLPSRFFSVRTENGLLFVMKLFQLFSGSFRLFLIAFAIFVNIPIFKLIYRESKHILVSTLVYMSVYWAFVSTTGLRQTVSIIVMCFFGLNSIRQRNLKRFLLCVFIAFLFHKSSLVFLPFYFLSNIRMTQQSISVSVVVILIVAIFRSRFADALLSFQEWYEHYAEQYATAGPRTFTLISAAILLLTFMYHREIDQNCGNAMFLENSAVMACVMLPFAFIDPSMLRAVFLFSIYSIWLVPEIIAANQGQSKKLILTITVAVLLFLIVTGTTPYKFMWETGIYSDIISPV